jgi:signal transduction histidine kinase
VKALVFSAALLLVLAVIAVAYRSTRAAEATLALAEHTIQVRHQLDALDADHARAVYARRAFVTSGDGSQLPQLPQLDAVMRRSLSEVRKALSQDPKQQEKLDDLSRVMDERLADLDASVERRLSVGHGEDQPRATLLSMNLRTLREEIAGAVDRQLTERITRTNRELGRARLAEIAGGAVSVGLLMALFYWMRREIEKRRRSQAALVEAKAVAESANAELREARATADRASQAKSDYLSALSHEIRTPMNAILGFAQLMQRDKKEALSSRQQERVEHILHGGEHLLRLIDDVLDLVSGRSPTYFDFPRIRQRD